MPRSLLPALFLSSAICLVGCTGPGWFTRVDMRSDRLMKRDRGLEDSQTQRDPRDDRSVTDGNGESQQRLSLSQMLDQVDRMKSENPTDYAVLQSALEDLPPQYQQVLKDQWAAVDDRTNAVQTQQGQSTVTHPLAQITPQHDPAVALAATTSIEYNQSRQANPVAPAAYAPREVLLPKNVPAVNEEPLIAPIVQAKQQVIAANQPEDEHLTATSHSESSTGIVPNEPALAVDATQEVLQQEKPSVNWNHEVEQALLALEADLANPKLQREERARLEVVRRFLHVLLNERDEAASPIEQLDEDEQEFVKHQMNALSIWLDTDGKHPTTRRAALSLRDLRIATDHLANVSTLDVRNIAFCKEVLSYGEYRQFDSYSFRPNAEVVLYVEVDNFAAHARGDDFETELHGSYEITDDSGRRVANVVLQVDKQLSRNRRRDYFIAYLIKMPTSISSGSYRLRLTIEDIIGKKSNYAAIDFRIE